MNIEEKPIALVIEKDDGIFRMIWSALTQKDYEVERVKCFNEAFEKAKAREYHRIVCSYKLTDAESFEFIGKLKSLPYNHSNLVLQTSAFLFDQEKIKKFDDLIHSEDMRKDLGKIFECSFENLNLENKFQTGKNYLEFSQKNDLPFDRTYIYDFMPEEVLIGIWSEDEESQQKEYQGKLILNICLKGSVEEIELFGKYEKVTPFDTNKGDVTYLSFQLNEQGKIMWKKYLDLFSDEDLILEQLLINARGF